MIMLSSGTEQFHEHPISQEGVEFVAEVLERHFVDPNDVIVVGGAVLGMYGLRMANDVDALARPSMYLYRSEYTPSNGIPRLSGVKTGVLTTPQRWSHSPSLDLIRPQITGGSIQQKDEDFTATQMRNPGVLHTDGIFHASLQVALDHKQQMRPKRPKDHQDIGLLMDVLGTKPSPLRSRWRS